MVNFKDNFADELCAGVKDYAAGVFDRMQWPPSISKYPFQETAFTITDIEPKIMVSGTDEFRPLDGLDDGTYTFATFDVRCNHPYHMHPWDNNSLRKAGATLAGFIQNVWAELYGLGHCSCEHDCCGHWFDRYIDCNCVGFYNGETHRRDDTSDRYFMFVLEHSKARNF